MTGLIRILLPLLLCLGCAGPKKGVLMDYGLTFESREKHVRLALPRMPGWDTTIPGKESALASCVVFGAVHAGKLTNVLLSVEPINSDLEDYFLIINEENGLDRRPGYIDMGMEKISLNGTEALKFTYAADVDLAGGQGDSLDLKTFVYTNILAKHEEFNYWLEVSVRSEVYETKKKLVEDIINRFEVLK